MTHLLLRDCTACGDVRAFETPDCIDGHGTDCPDLACVECGEALFIGFPCAQLDGDAESIDRIAPAA